jgi:hypothetical protein
LTEFLQHHIYPRLLAEIAFSWSGHSFKASGDKLRGNCPWHESESGTAFYVDKKDGVYLWRCPACEIGGGVIEYRHRLNGGNGSPRGKDFVDIVRQLADDVGVSMPMPERDRSSSSTRRSRKLDGSGNNAPSVTTLSLRERVHDILIRNLSAIQQKEAFINLEKSTGYRLREIEQLADLIQSELDLTEDRAERVTQLEQLLSIGNRRLTLSRYLPPNLAKPLDQLATWMGVDVEALLTVLLPTSASLLHPQTRVIVKECINFVEPIIFYTGIVSESGNRKSPIFKTITEPLRKLQEDEDIRYKEAQKQYQKDLKAWKGDRSEDKGEPPEPPEPPREYFVDNTTSEALDRIKAQQAQHGILIRKDELSGLFVGASKHNSSNLQTRHFQTRIICN